MVEMDDLAGKVFALLKGNGLQVKIFDDQGAETTDPTTGRRFFVVDPNIMVTIDEDSNSIEFSKGSSVDDSINGLQKNIRKIADEFLMNSNIKVFGKQIQPRDYAYQAKMKKGTAMMENIPMQPHNHHLLGEVFKKIKHLGTATARTLASALGADLSEIQPILNRLIKSGKISGQSDSHGDIMYSITVEEAVMEDGEMRPHNHQLVGQILNIIRENGELEDTAIADQLGVKLSDVRPILNKLVSSRKIIAAQPNGYLVYSMAMDEAITESFSRMFGSLKTSQQTLENVRILVRHSTPVDESVRGARSRHISAIFLECNGERMRFGYNYLPGARAMAQHMAHGGVMTDKVGAYISESTGQLLKLQSFNRYVTTNKLINEASSDIVEIVKENIQTLRTELKKITGSKTYETVKARLETYEREPLAEDNISELKDIFTVRRFDEKIEEALMIAAQLIQEKNTFHKRIEEAAMNVIILRRETMSTTPIFEFASENARLGFKLNEFALRIMENDELSLFVNKIGTKLCKEGTVNDFERAVLKQVLENARVEEKTIDTTTDIKESIELGIYFDRFDYKFM